MHRLIRARRPRRISLLVPFSAALLAVVIAGSAQAQQSHIVGGSTQTLSQWPGTARVLVTGAYGVSTCSGTVVAPNLVLTAAHCVDDPSAGTESSPSQIQVVTGTATFSGGQRSGVSQVLINPSFQDVGASLTDYDAALLVLSTQTTQPAVTLASPADSALYSAGTSVSVVGWGQTSGTATSYSTTLQAGQLGILSQSTCQKDSQSSFGTKLDTNDQICALSSTGTEGICFGDSGGPLMATDAYGDDVELGLTIWNTGNCVTNQPDYFTSISGVSSWLSTEISALATALQPTSGTSGSSSSASNQSTSKPRVGEYAGKTGLARSVSIMVAKSQSEVSTATVTVQLRCTRLKHLLTYTIAPRGGSYWPRRITQNKGRGFKDTLTFHGWHVVLGTYFWTNGKAKGSVTVAGSNKADGSCRTGTVRWTAKIS